MICTTSQPLVYINSSQLEKALKTLKQTDDWRTIFVIANRLKYSPKDIKILAYEMAETLQSMSKYQVRNDNISFLIPFYF